MNIPIRVGSDAGDEALEKEFAKQSTEMGFLQLKGHRYAQSVQIYISIIGINAHFFSVICSIVVKPHLRHISLDMHLHNHYLT